MKRRMHAPYYLIALLFASANHGFLRLVEAVSSVRLTKTCFSAGENINVRFVDVMGEGVFIGLYPTSALPDRNFLPEITSSELKEWILTCGRRDNCDSWSERGFVQLPTDGLSDGQYIIAVSGDRAGRTPQALTREFTIGGCGFFGESTPIVVSPTAPVPQPVQAVVQAAPVPRPTAAPVPAPVPVQDPPGTPFVVNGGIQGVLDDARFQIENLIRNDGDLTGKFLRLVFHDCIKGCDGCVDMANPDNAGLDKPINVLQDIVNNFRDRGLTRTDIWMLAGLVATETAIPANDRDIQFDIQWIGRKTCEERRDCGVDFNGNPTTCTPMRGPHVGQAHATLGTRNLQSFFEDEFNFSPQQITALMGAHSVGRMSRENSGFSGRWDLSEAQFDGGYWIELIGNPPDFFLETVNNNDLAGIPNRRQYAGIVSPQSRVTMLHTDIALVRFVDDMQNGNANCDFTGPNACTQDTPFMPHAQRYTSNNREWLFDFRDVFNVLIDHGHEKRINCPFDRICSFGFQEPNTISAEGSGQSSSVSSSSVSSSFGQTSSDGGFFDNITFNGQGFNGNGQVVNGQATLSLDKRCYNFGETIVVEYDGISGENVWIGIFRADDVSDVQNLPADPDSQNGLLKDWNFSCGHRICHTWNSRGGLQFSTHNLQQDDRYTIVISGAGGSLRAQAAVSFSLGGC